MKKYYNRYHWLVFVLVMSSFMLLLCSAVFSHLIPSTSISVSAQADTLATPKIRPTNTVQTDSIVDEPQIQAIEATVIPPPIEPTPLLLKQMQPLQIPNHPQERNLSCEFRSATDLATYYGWEFTWEELFKQVGHDPNGNPNVGFVGRSIDDPPGGIYPAGYGVYAKPVAKGLRDLGVNATAYEEQTVEWLKLRLTEGHPVIVWATAGLSKSQIVEWQTKDGITVQGVPHEHTFTAVGYDEVGIYLNDPYTGETDYYTWEQFQPSWLLLGNMALVINEVLPE